MTRKQGNECKKSKGALERREENTEIERVRVKTGGRGERIGDRRMIESNGRMEMVIHDERGTYRRLLTVDIGHDGRVDRRRIGPFVIRWCA